jgi:uncharacterized protein with von Willebrand factor type A (vWA) domain
MNATAASAAPAGLNLPRLAQALRDSGVKVGSGSVLVAAQALACVDLARRDDVRDALRAALIHEPADFELFDSLFALLFPEQRVGIAGSHPNLPRSEDLPPAPGGRRIAAALPQPGVRQMAAPEMVERDAAGSASDTEILASKDFEQMSAAELEAARRLLAVTPPRTAQRQTRRLVADPRGRQLDLRRTLRQMLRGVDPLPLPRRRRQQLPRDWVLLVDVSGSMAAYSRMALHLAWALARRGGRLEVFTFATRLTRLTRAMRNADPDVALQTASRNVTDWDGGTRIAEALADFNHRWARRVLTRAPWVVLLTDGLERSGVEQLDVEVARLARQCRELIWINPLRRSPLYQPLAAGAAVLDRHATRRLSAHSVDSLLALTRLIESDSPRQNSHVQP